VKRMLYPHASLGSTSQPFCFRYAPDSLRGQVFSSCTATSVASSPPTSSWSSSSLRIQVR
jgi:hypothetical protein